MNKVKILAYSIFAFIIGVFISFLALKIMYKPKQPKPIVKTKIVKKIVKVPVVETTPGKINEKRLTEWIYQNSFRCSRKQAKQIAHLLLQTKYPLLFAAIIKNESSFNITAYSKSKAIGLMQILPTSAHLNQLKKAGIINEPRDLFNPETNIKAGQLIFTDILKINNNNIRKALKMYCGGSGVYVKNVLQTLGEITIFVKN